MFSLRSRHIGTRSALLPVGALVVVTLGLTGCEAETNDGAEDATQLDTEATEVTGDEPQADAETSEIDASLDEWSVELTRNEVSAGTVVFNVMNDGTVPHALEVEGQGIEEETDTLEPGETATLEVDLQPGTYKVYCPVVAGGTSHEDQGMVTELTVTESGY